MHKIIYINSIERIPQVPRFPQEQKNQVYIVFDWLQIALDEGHIEPSQPCVGRLLGWPQRRFCIKSLWIDFLSWCRKKELDQNQIANSDLFYLVLDRIFLREGDRYDFPDLCVCRTNYAILRRSHEFVAISE